MTRYANIEWLLTDRGADLDDYFGRASKRIANAQDAGSARAAFDGLVRRLGDGHIEIEWPQPGTPSAAATPMNDVCAETGYNAANFGAPLAALMPGYTQIRSGSFPAGLNAGGHRIGVLKIGLFGPEGMPALCRAG